MIAHLSLHSYYSLEMIEPKTVWFITRTPEQDQEYRPEPQTDSQSPPLICRYLQLPSASLWSLLIQRRYLLLQPPEPSTYPSPGYLLPSPTVSEALHLPDSTWHYILQTSRANAQLPLSASASNLQSSPLSHHYLSPPSADFRSSLLCCLLPATTSHRPPKPTTTCHASRQPLKTACRPLLPASTCLRPPEAATRPLLSAVTANC